MSEGTTYKWKYKRDKNRSTKPYARPTNESLVSSVTSAIKDKLIPNWLKGVANYLMPSGEEHIEAVVNEDACVAAQGDDASSEPSVTGNELQHECNEPTSVFSTSERLSRSALNSPTDQSRSDPATLNSQPLITNRINETAIDEEGSSTTSNTASSTSGCSSLFPSDQEHLLQKLSFPNLGKSDLERLKKELMKKTRDVAVETEPKQSSSETTKQMPSFLWSTGGKRKADFSVSNFFAPNSVIAAENKSPFYEGKTTFGGASSKRARLAASSPYTVGTHKIPSIVKVKAKESRTVESSLSSTARRILESMEKMSSPLEDAKKLPSYKEVESKHMIINPIKQFRKSIPGRLSSTFSFKPFVPAPNEETKSSNSTNQQPSEALKTIGDKKEAEINISAGGKIRTTVTKITSRKVHRLDDVAEEISLPNEPLPIKSLPSFSFKKDIEQKSVKNVYLPKPTTNVTRILEMDGEKDVCEFKFTAPFLPPKLNGSNVVEEVKIDVRTLDRNNTGTASTKVVEKVKVNSEETNDRSSLPDVTIKKTNSVGVLGKDDKPSFKSSWNWSNVNSWSCPVCMIQNSNDKLKCIACEACKPGTEVIVPKKSNSVNENDTTKKVCDNVVPATKKENKPEENTVTSNPKTHTEKITSSWGSKFAAPANTWECDTCLVRNKDADSKCISCETPKTSTQDKSAFNKVYSGFNFGNVDTSNNSFVAKFGIPQNDKPVTTNTDTTETLSPKKVTFSVQSEGFGGFSNTSPTYSMTTTSTTIALTTTTGSQFNFGSLSSPKTNNTVSIGETISISKPVDTSDNSVKFKNVNDKPPTLIPATTTTFSTDKPKLNKEETSSAPSLFTFGTSTAKASEGFAFNKKEVEKSEVKTGNFVFGKPIVQNSPFAVPAATTTSISTFGSFTSENKPTVTKSSDFRYPSVFENPQKSEATAFTTISTTVTSAAATTSTASLSTNTTNTQSGFKFSFGSNNNSLAKPVTNSESTSIPTTTTVTSKTPIFSFGASSAKTNAEPFSFSNDSTSQPASSGGFKFSFGNNSSLNTSGFTPSSATSAVLQTTPTTTAVTTTTSGGFTFGSMLNTSKVVSPSFTFGSAAQPVTTTTATPSFNFNEKPASVFTFTGTAKNSSLQSPSNFSFDQRQSAPQNFASTTSPFVFGSQPANTPINTMSQGFNFNSNNNNNTLGTEFKPASFGQNSLTSPQFHFGQPANQQPATSGLTFGAPAVPTPIITPQPPLPINFSQTPNINFSGQTSVGQPGAVFQFNANTSENPLSTGLSTTRSIKKAKRRLGGPS